MENRNFKFYCSASLRLAVNSSHALFSGFVFVVHPFFRVVFAVVNQKRAPRDCQRRRDWPA